MLKKVVVISNTSFADVEYLINFGDPEILDGLNAIEINDVKLAKRLAGFLKFHDHFDIFIISKEKSVLDQIYKIYPYARLVYEVDHLYNFNKLKHDILGHHSYTVLISDGEINQLTVRQLKRHGIVVFNRVTDEVTIVRSMLAGVDGIVGKDIKELPDLNVDYGLSPFVIAHRGFHKETQENSVKASIKAHQLDADYVEMDIHMTKDNKIVVNHDATLGRTFEKDYVIKKEKLRTLQEVKMVFKEEILQEKLPLLKDFDHALVESNIGFIIESKTDSKFAMRRLARVVNTINRPVLLMSFYPYSIIHMKKYMPNIVNGILLDFNMNKMSLKSLIKTSNKYQMMIHPYYKHERRDYCDELKKRAINVSPWGASEKDVIPLFLKGYYGVNSDNIDKLIEVIKFVSTKREVTYDIGEKQTLELKSDKLLEVEKEILIFDACDTGLTVLKDEITGAVNEGIAYIYMVTKVKLGSTRYRLASDLIKVNVREKQPD